MTKSIQKLDVRDLPDEFLTWLKTIKEERKNFNVVINEYKITHLYVNEVDDHNWSDIQFGRILGGQKMAIKQYVYKPRIVNNNFVKNYNG